MVTKNIKVIIYQLRNKNNESYHVPIFETHKHETRFDNITTDFLFLVYKQSTMKNIIYIIFAFLVIVGCSKEQEFASQDSALIECDQSSKATVHFMQVDDVGKDDFYYLELTDEGSSESRQVYPHFLEDKYKKDGTELTVEFGSTGLEHKFVFCIGDHEINPDDPEEHVMPIVSMCSSIPSDD